MSSAIVKLIVITTHAEPRVYADMVERVRVDVRAEVSDCIVHGGAGFDNLLEASAYARGVFDGRRAAGEVIRVVHRLE